MVDWMKLIGGVAGILMSFFLIGVLFAFPIVWMWNYVMPDVFGLPIINVWQAFWGSFMIRLIFSGITLSK